MSGLKRFFVNEIKDEVIIEGDEYRHAVSVLRIQGGESVILCDNTEFEYVAKVVEISKKRMVLQVEEKIKNEKEADAEVMLIAGFLKGDKTEYVVQKATELGIKKVLLFDSKFSSAFISENKLERLNKVAVESAKQCGRSIAPKVEYVKTFKQALEAGNGYQNKLFAYECAESSSADLAYLKGSTAYIIGSEGGFAEDEAQMATEYGYKTISLGKRILRADTAAIALGAIIMYNLKELN